jgi:sterol desaturase/sphingolipid hydroxylase (fatty acid hydroxylase superfamily)
VIIYKILIYLPLVILGVNETVIFAILVLSLLMQELVHANLNWDWGPLRYVINSPRLHAWHHSVELHGKDGQNFCVNLAIWDWLFRTAYWPRNGGAPAHFGFDGMKYYPKSVWGRLWSPFARKRLRNPAVELEQSNS